jgi:hypothetical protein
MKNEFTIFKEISKDLIIDKGMISYDYFRDFRLLSRKTVRILVIVDTSVNFTPDAGFGVGRIIKFLRETNIGCVHFEVDVAQRIGTPGTFTENASPSDTVPKYSNFRFDAQINNESVLNKYHEVFMFGFAPDNDGLGDERIANHPWYTTVSELTVLEEWMNNGGGVFATGDHDYLGASLCHRIPRVGTMRKWTNSDGVPPIGGNTRLDTNRATNANQVSGVESIPNAVERDSIPQEIEWIADRTFYSGFKITRYPHAILCHPKHGPINVMPDHPHEGCCNEIFEINLDANLKYASRKEYPTINGVRPEPKIIAYGNVLGMSNHQKGPVNARRFPMISVYDGRSVEESKIGRIVVDSTWHHWFNMNINGFESAVDKTNWEKISRYFLNIANWLTPKNISQQRCWWDIVAVHFDYEGIREVNMKSSLMESGFALKNFLIREKGQCAVTEFVFHNICRINPKICQLYRERELKWLIDPVCLSCPPFDVIEILVLGSIFKATRPIADEIRNVFDNNTKKRRLELSFKEVDTAVLSGTNDALKYIFETMLKEQVDLQSSFKY